MKSSIKQLTVAYQHLWCVARWLIASLIIGGVPVASAFDDLTEAQQLVYAEHHLRDTTEGQSLVYQYQSLSPDEDTVEDTVVLNVNKVGDENRRDVQLEFLTDTRRMILPPFDGYRGNPVVIAMLEHIAQSVGKETGGGVLYFRNRIRDSLAVEGLAVTAGNRTFGGESIATRQIEFMPFVDDKFLNGDMRYEKMKYRLVFSTDVPAGVLEVSVESSADDGSIIASRRLTLSPVDG